MDKTSDTTGTAPAADQSAAPTAPAAAAPAAAAPAPAAPLSFGQRLAAAGAGLVGKGTSADVEALKGQLATANAERDTLQAKVARLEKELADANAKVAEAESAVTDFEKKVASASVNLVASAGVPVKDLPAAEAGGSSTGVPATRAELEERMKNMTLDDSIELLREFNAAHSNN